MLDVIGEAAKRLCAADRVTMWQQVEHAYHLAAMSPDDGEVRAYLERNPIAPDTGSTIGRALLARATVHVPDVAEVSEPRYAHKTPGPRLRAMLGVPLLRFGEPVGVIGLSRFDSMPFSARQIALVETFADQAVIAIENARLFEAEQTRSRELQESLKYQTATAAILNVISQSPTDSRPVLERIAHTVCELMDAKPVTVFTFDGALIHVAAFDGMESEEGAAALLRTFPSPPGPTSATARAIDTLLPCYIPDVMADTEYVRSVAQAAKYRSIVSVPMLREGRAVGAITASNAAVDAFAPKKIALLETFAEQAVIAMNNARLFEAEQARARELQESLEYQTATSNVLSVISRSTDNSTPVFASICETAIRLCEADRAVVHLRDGDRLLLAASRGTPPERDRALASLDIEESRSSVIGRAVLDLATVHVETLDRIQGENGGTGLPSTMLSVPLVRNGTCHGAITVARETPRPFSKRQIALIETFSSQAVIAIDNARLLHELQTRQRELTQALESQTAVSDILAVISRFQFRLPEIFDALAKSAGRLCEADRVGIHLKDGDSYPLVAHIGFPEELAHRISKLQHAPGGTSMMSQMLAKGGMIEIADGAADPTPTASSGHSDRSRSFLGIPLIQGGQIVGGFTLGRLEPRAFTKNQIQLVETFADQAVIAIENARLLDELQTRRRELEARTDELTESLEYQTAISSVLGVISRSRFDLQPVLDTIVASAAQLGEADKVGLRQKVGDHFPIKAQHGFENEAQRYLVENTGRIVPGEGFLGQIISKQKTLHWSAEEMEEGHAWPKALEIMQVKTSLGLPLMRDGELLGTLALWRTESRPFTPRQIALVETFADQAVIAIENARLLDELQARQRELEARSAELAESLDYQTAISSVFAIIAKSSRDLQPVYDAIVTNAAKICGASAANFLLFDGQLLTSGATWNRDPAANAVHRAGYPMRPNRALISGRTVLDRRVIRVTDILTDADYPGGRATAANVRSLLGIPLLRNDEPIGAIVVGKPEAEAYSESQVALLETFADQAVIAIENARLLDELQTRQRELEEALGNQTAMAEVQEVISHSPTASQPVFEAIARSIRRLTGAIHGSVFVYDGELIKLVALDRLDDGAGTDVLRQSFPQRPGRTGATSRAIMTGATQYICDVHADPDYSVAYVAEAMNYHSIVSVPMLREGRPVGAITASHSARNAFDQKQIALFRTFADQAVIAMNNARLFEEVQARTRELQQSLEYQTAMSEVLSVIGSSPTNPQPVFETIAANATRLCDARWTVVGEFDGTTIDLVAMHNIDAPAEAQAVRDIFPRRLQSGGTMDDALIERKVVYVADVHAKAEYPFDSNAGVLQLSSNLAVPILRRGEPVGVISVGSSRKDAFTVRQIELLKAFADQAVIALNNVGLFDEVQARSRELAEALGSQTATSEVLEVISRSPSELGPVLNTIVNTGARLCEADRAVMWLCQVDKLSLEGDEYRLAAWSTGVPEGRVEEIRNIVIRPSQRSVVGRAIISKEVLHYSERELTDPELLDMPRGPETALVWLCIPLVHDSRALGALVLTRTQNLPFTPKQIALAKTFASQSIIAINNVGLFEAVQTRSRELARSVEEMRSLAEVGRTVSSSLDMSEVLSTILQHACRITDTSGGTLYVYDRMSGAFRVEAAHNMLEEHLERVRAHPMHIGDAVVGECAEQREAVQVADLAKEDPTRSPLIGILIRGGTRALLAVPLLHQGEVLGALIVRRGRPGAFTPETVRLLETFAAQSAIAVNNARLFNEIRDKGRELELASQHKSQFLANMSHELARRSTPCSATPS